MAQPAPVKVFISHRFDDMERAKMLAAALLAAGFDAWLDAWEVLAGDNFVAAMQKGISEADGCLVLLSNSGVGTGWMNEEVSAVLVQMVEDRNKRSRPFVLIPVLLDPDVIPPVLLRHRAPRPAGDLQGIIDGLRRKSGKPAIGPSAPPLAATRRIALDLKLAGETLGITLTCDNDAGAALPPLSASSTLPAATLTRLSTTLKPIGALRHADGTSIREHTLRNIGVELGKVILPEPLGTAFRQVLHDRDTDEKHTTRIELLIHADSPALFALPFEAMVLPDPSAAFSLPLAMVPRLSVSRVVTGGPAIHLSAAPGPLRILVVAVPAGDTGLDFDNELGVVLDAVDKVRGQKQSIVDFIDDELPTLEAIHKALEREAFHVVHISAHGEAGALVFQGDKGPVKVTPADLARALKRDGQAPPLAVLSARDSGRAGVELDRRHVALTLCEKGVPRVVAMSHPVSDVYATDLAGKLYGHLAQGDLPLPADALAEARRDCEEEKAKKGAAAGGRVGESELATPVFYVRKEAQGVALFDRSLPFDTSRKPAELIVVPGFTRRRVRYFVGRRRLRTQLVAAMEGEGSKGAMVLGMGGAGKSCLVASLLERQVRQGWLPVVVVGKTSLGGVAEAIGKQVLLNEPENKGLGDDVKALAKALAQDKTALTDDDRVRISINLLATTKVALVLDNFEDNQVGLDQATGAQGRPMVDQALAGYLRLVIANARKGAVILTSRYPVPELKELKRVDVTTLDPLEVRKLLWRLPGFAERTATEAAQIAKELGGHPRALEFADALFRNATDVEFTDIVERIHERAAGIDLEGLGTDQERIDAARRIAAADVFLDKLLDLARRDEGLVPLLAAVAVFEVPVPKQAVEVAARGIQLAPSLGGVAGALERLAALSLVTAAREGWKTEWVVHRWTAHEVWKREARNPEVDALVAAWWEGEGEGARALEHWLAADCIDDACRIAFETERDYEKLGRASDALAVCTRMAKALEADSARDNERVAFLLDAGDQLVALGNRNLALSIFSQVVQIVSDQAATDPTNLNIQQRLSLGLEKMGEVEYYLGNWEKAGAMFQRSVEIRVGLLRLDPSKDCAIGVSDSYTRIAHMHLQQGNLEEALNLYRTSLAILLKWATNDPKDLEVGLRTAMTVTKVGDALSRLERAQEGVRYYEEGLAMAKILAAMAPNRLDVVRHLGGSYEKLGQHFWIEKDSVKALAMFSESVKIAKELSEREPERMDLLTDLGLALTNLSFVHPESRAVALQARAVLRHVHERGALDSQYVPALEILDAVFG